MKVRTNVSKALPITVIGTLTLVSLLTPICSWAQASAEEFWEPSSVVKWSGDLVKSVQAMIASRPDVKALLDRGDHKFLLKQKIRNAVMETTKFQHYFKGLEVVGSMTFHHRTLAGEKIRLVLSQFDVQTNPTLSAEQAVSLARGFESELELKNSPILKILPSEGDDSARLVYWVTFQGTRQKGGMDVLIDAHSGETLAELPHWITIAPINVTQADDSCQEVDAYGAPLSLDFSHCNKTVVQSEIKPEADESARRAVSNSTAVLNFYANELQRDSYDARGSKLDSVVHVGHKFSNAFWSNDEDMMAYGDGDGVEFRDFTLGLDVAGHEMTHGVTARTAALIYKGESGALNEATSDFFGKMIASSVSPDEDWTIGRQLSLDPSTSKGIRDLATPGNLTVTYKDSNGKKVTKPYPAHMKDEFKITNNCGRTNDNCWVHVNSTIPAHALYLVVQAIGKEKTTKLYYTVLTQFLTATSNFKAARDATVQACGQLYDAATCNSVSKSFEAVGL